MPDVVLTTLNARYAHAAFGLRYLAANMGELESRTRILEFTIQERPVDIAEAILAQRPRIVGLGVYIWNVRECAELVRILRSVAPEVVIVVGGPEVSHEIEDQPWLEGVDYVVCGEADLRFAELCGRILAGQRPLTRVLEGGLPDIGSLRLPYHLYDDQDIRHRVLYVEASRGCPYRCEFCLSSLDEKVRGFDLERLLGEFDALIERGARQFKFVDRTFNLDLRRSAAILEFFLERIHHGLFLHFEMVPDRLPPDLRELIARFPPGALQFEVGIQSLDPEVGARIQRRQDLERTFDNLDFLKHHTGVHVHTDLIIGLPGETVEAFGAGLDRLIATGVQEVQIGVLKRLRGTPIARHTEPFGLVFDPHPPYAILRSAEIDFETMQRLKRFSLVWSTFWNRGDMPTSMRRMWGDDSPFWTTVHFADWLFAKHHRVHGLSIENRARALADYLVECRGVSQPDAHACIERDFVEQGRRPPALDPGARSARARARSGTPARQQRHVRHG